MSQAGYDLTTARRNPYAERLRKNGYYIKIFVPPEEEREQSFVDFEITNEELAMLKEFVAREEAKRKRCLYGDLEEMTQVLITTDQAEKLKMQGG